MKNPKRSNQKAQGKMRIESKELESSHSLYSIRYVILRNMLKIAYVIE